MQRINFLETSSRRKWQGINASTMIGEVTKARKARIVAAHLCLMDEPCFCNLPPHQCRCQ
jgi:hypothetical protein